MLGPSVPSLLTAEQGHGFPPIAFTSYLVRRFRNSIHIGGVIEVVGPSVDYGVSIKVIHGGHDAILEFLFGCDADMAQHRAGELGEEAFDEIEPRAVLWRKGEFEAIGRLLGEPKPWSPWRCGPNDCRGSA